VISSPVSHVAIGDATVASRVLLTMWLLRYRCCVLCVMQCRDAWHALQSSRDPQVLCAVVSCMPRLMAALGPVLTHREMLPALAALLQSHLTWVAGQLVQVMADLLQQLPPSGHDMLLKVIMAP